MLTHALRDFRHALCLTCACSGQRRTGMHSHYAIDWSLAVTTIRSRRVREQLVWVERTYWQLAIAPPGPRSRRRA